MFSRLRRMVVLILVNICTKVNSKDVYYAKLLLFSVEEAGRATDMKHYMEILRGLREDNDLTQFQIARVLGISQTMYARYERKANELPIRHLVALCEYYNVSSDVVLNLRPRRREHPGGSKGER